MTARYTPWIVGFAALAGAGLVVFQMTPDPVSAPRLVEQRSPVEANADDLLGIRCAFEEGDTSAWELSSAQQTTVDTASLGLTPAGTTPVQLHQQLSLRLEAEVLSTSDDHALLLGHIRDVEGNALGDPTRIAAPFLFRVGSRCDVQGFAYLDGTPRPFARVQQSLLHELQWHAPRQQRERWSSHNGTGAFEAVVATAGGLGEPLSVHRRIDAYDPYPAAQGARVEHSVLDVHLGDGLWFSRASLEERIVFGGASMRRTFSARTVPLQDGQLASLPRDESKYVWEDLLPLDLPLPERTAPTQKERDAIAHLVGVPLDRAVGAYVRRIEAKVPIHQTWPELRDWLEANPSGAAELVNTLKAGTLPAEATMGTYFALGNTRTKEAKSALMGIMTDSKAPTFDRSRAIIALIDRPDTGIGLASHLAGYAGNIERGESRGERILARQSILALGAMAGRKPENQEVRSLALHTATSALSSLKSANHLRPVYNAIANMGNPADLEYVKDVPNHPDRDVRKAAASVFRRMPPAGTNAFVAGWLRSETSWMVKRVLYNTLELQTFDAGVDPSDEVLRLAMRDLKTRPGVMTRKDISRILVRALERRPEDPLGIKLVLKELIPYELEERSGLYVLLAGPFAPNELDDVPTSAPAPQDAAALSPISPAGHTGGAQ